MKSGPSLAAQHHERVLEASPKAREFSPQQSFQPSMHLEQGAALLGLPSRHAIPLQKRALDMHTQQKVILLAT